MDEFEVTNDNHLLFFQPAVHIGPYRVIPFTTPINRDGVVYAPHFYPDLFSFDTSRYDEMWERFNSEAQTLGTPLFIGEFGLPWKDRDDGNTAKENSYQGTQIKTLELFDSSAVGFSRPWFSDDNAKVQFINLNWAVIKGTSGLDGKERTFIIDVISRPYPMRVAGQLSSFSFDINTKTFLMDYTPSDGVTTIYIPQSRHYGSGMTIMYNDLEFKIVDSTIEIIDNPKNADIKQFEYNDKIFH